MWKWLKKFALEIAPPVTATVLGAFVVHQLWPSGDPKPQPAITPPAALAPAESPKAASVPSADTSTTATVPAATPSPATVTSVAPKAGKPSRQSNEVTKEVAKTTPRDEAPAPRGESEASVLDRAEKALASIPPAPTKSAGPSLPTRGAAPPVVAMHEPQATPVAPPAPQVTTAAVAPTEPPPMDPPREISAPVAPIAAPPPSLLPQQNQQAQTKNGNPLRVSHSDRENLADIPVGDDVAPDQAPAAAASADAAPPPPPAKPKNFIENIFAPLQSVLPERMRN